MILSKLLISERKNDMERNLHPGAKNVHLRAWFGRPKILDEAAKFQDFEEKSKT